MRKIVSGIFVLLVLTTGCTLKPSPKNDAASSEQETVFYIELEPETQEESSAATAEALSPTETQTSEASVPEAETETLQEFTDAYPDIPAADSVSIYGAWRFTSLEEENGSRITFYDDGTATVRLDYSDELRFQDGCLKVWADSAPIVIEGNTLSATFEEEEEPFLVLIAEDGSTPSMESGTYRIGKCGMIAETYESYPTYLILEGENVWLDSNANYSIDEGILSLYMGEDDIMSYAHLTEDGTLLLSYADGYEETLVPVQ